MTDTGANRVPPTYQLTDELARYCLPAANRDQNRTLAWVNSICILFLIIGVLGNRPGSVSIKPLPPLEEVAPIILEPAPPPPQTVTVAQNEPQTEKEKPETPQVVVTPETPAINFSVPTIGTLVAPASLAEAPPLHPLQPPAPVRTGPAQLNNTGQGGDRPEPPYPKIAQEEAQEGTVTVLMTADEAGNIVSIDVQESSGSPILDHSTVEFIKRHWTLPAGRGNRLFQTSITYKLQSN
jgi:TonB family protein